MSVTACVFDKNVRNTNVQFKNGQLDSCSWCCMNFWPIIVIIIIMMTNIIIIIIVMILDLAYLENSCHFIRQISREKKSSLQNVMPFQQLHLAIGQSLFFI